MHLDGRSGSKDWDENQHQQHHLELGQLNMPRGSSIDILQFEVRLPMNWFMANHTVNFWASLEGLFMPT